MTESPRRNDDAHTTKGIEAKWKAEKEVETITIGDRNRKALQYFHLCTHGGKKIAIPSQVNNDIHVFGGQGNEM